MRGIAGIQVGGAIDFCEQITEVYGQNFDHPVAVADIMEVDATVQRVRKWEETSGPFKVAQMSSPCTDFSKAGKRIETSRSWVTIAGILAVIRLNITALVIENVTGLLKSQVWGRAKGILAEANYHWDYMLLDAQEFGVPQRRQRVFILAIQGKKPWARGIIQD